MVSEVGTISCPNQYSRDSVVSLLIQEAVVRVDERNDVETSTKIPVAVGLKKKVSVRMNSR